LEGIKKSFSQPGGGRVEVLRGIDLTVESGTLTAIVGPSGSGKSTLLHVLGLMARPDEGKLTVLGKEAGTLSERQRDALRRQAINFLFQFDSLLEELTLEENWTLAAGLKAPSGKPDFSLSQPLELAARLGLSGALRRFPRDLSSGERTRANLVRAMLGRPALILADEPTGNLDPKNAKQVAQELMELLSESKNNGLARPGIVLATHNWQLAAQAQSIYRLEEGRLVAADPRAPAP
jgi:lipoprotein-releasing system ATP-binding protein